MNSIAKSRAKILVTALSLFFAMSANADPLLSSKLTKSERHKIEEISSIFENSSPDFQYDYIQDIGDGSGVTAGRIGFNTDSGDLLEVVEKYSRALSGKTPLAEFIPCLKAYAKTQSYACLFPSVSASVLTSDDFKDHGLTQFDFGLDWVRAAKTPLMKKVQDGEVQENVYDVADDWSKKIGMKTAFGYAVLFDVVLQQGGDVTTNSMGGMVRRTQNTFLQMHPGLANPGAGANEAEWLSVFLLQRRETLRFGYNDNDVENTTEVPYQSYPRADSLIEILNENNPDLSAPISFHYFGDAFVITR